MKIINVFRMKFEGKGIKYFLINSFLDVFFYPTKKQAERLAFCFKYLTLVTVVLHPHTLCCVYRLFDRVPAPSLLFLHRDCLIET